MLAIVASTGSAPESSQDASLRFTLRLTTWLTLRLTTWLQQRSRTGLGTRVWDGDCVGRPRRHLFLVTGGASVGALRGLPSRASGPPCARAGWSPARRAMVRREIEDQGSPSGCGRVVRAPGRSGAASVPRDVPCARFWMRIRPHVRPPVRGHVRGPVRPHAESWPERRGSSSPTALAATASSRHLLPQTWSLEYRSGSSSVRLVGAGSLGYRSGTQPPGARADLESDEPPVRHVDKADRIVARPLALSRLAAA